MMDMSLLVADIYKQCLNANVGEKIIIKSFSYNKKFEENLEKLGCFLEKDNNRLILVKKREYVALFNPDEEIDNIISKNNPSLENLKYLLKIVKAYELNYNTVRKLLNRIHKKVSTIKS
jgi:uncharacterized SAM-dependent methyltransferase